MVAVLSVVRFDDEERAALAADKADRGKLAAAIGRELTTQVNAMFGAAREIADKDPDANDLTQATLTVDNVESIIKALPQSEQIEALLELCARLRGIYGSALESLPR